MVTDTHITKATRFLNTHPVLYLFARSLFELLQFIKNPENLSGRNIHLTKKTIKEWID